MRVKGGPQGKGAAKRVGVSYGSGDRLEVKVDGSVVRHAQGYRLDTGYRLEATVVDGGVVRHTQHANPSSNPEQVLFLSQLFARVTPDDCAWTLDSGEVVVTLEKVDAKPWSELTLPGVGVSL